MVIPPVFAQYTVLQLLLQEQGENTEKASFLYLSGKQK